MIRRYLPILLVAVLASYYSFTVAKTLKLDTNLTSLLPKGVPSVENLKKVIDKAGGYSSAMVIVLSPDPDSALSFLTELRERVLKYKWVSSAEYAENIGILDRHKLLYMETKDLEEINRRLEARITYEKSQLRFKIDETPVHISIRNNKKLSPPRLDFKDIEKKYSSDDKKQGDSRKFFRNDSGTITLLAVLPKGRTTNVDFSRQIIAQINKEIEELDPKKFHPELSVLVGGRVGNMVAKYDATLSDISGSAVWSIGGILLVIIFFYRRLLSLVYIGLPLLMGFLWTFMIVQLVLGSLNLITLFLTLVLFGLGVDFGVHNFSRYDEVRKEGGDLRDALRTVYTHTGRASLLAASTTIVGFYSVMISDFRAFYEFGFIAGTGVALTFLSMYFVFPPLMVLAERVRLYRIGRFHAETHMVTNAPFPLPRSILVVALVMSVASVIVLPGLSFEDNFSKLKIRVEKVDEANDYIREVFPLRSDKAVVFVEDLEDLDAVVAAAERIRKSRPVDPTIKKVKSIYSVIPSSKTQRQRLKIIDSIHVKLDESLGLARQFDDTQTGRKSDLEELMKYTGISELEPTDLPPALYQAYTGVPGSGGYLVYIYNSKGVGNLADAQAFVDDIREIEANGKIFYPATQAMIFVDMLNLMKEDAATAIGAVLITMFIVLVLVYGNILKVLVILTPVCIGMLWMLGIMAWLDLRLNIFNMVVLPSVLGIGIDNGIHIYHRFWEDRGAHVLHVVRTTGGAAFLTTLTTVLGFAGALASSHTGLQSLGLVACIGLGTCMLGSLTVLPALLQVIQIRSQRSGSPVPG
ncbi:RND family transporter [Pseudomonadota bacterium]